MACGVARFNSALANTLSIELGELEDLCASSLLSLKVEELNLDSIHALEFYFAQQRVAGVIFHGWGGTKLELLIAQNSDFIFTLNGYVSREIEAATGKKVCFLSTPGSFLGMNQPHQIEKRLLILTFGMVHKLKAQRYEQLWSILEGDFRNPLLLFSTAVHTGEDNIDSVWSLEKEISKCYEGPFEFLGVLSDATLYRYLSQVHIVVAFFDTGVRDNNSSAIAAMQAGKLLVTNSDSYSPKWMKHGVNFLDINRIKSIPTSEVVMRIAKQAAKDTQGITFSKMSSEILALLKN